MQNCKISTLYGVHVDKYVDKPMQQKGLFGYMTKIGLLSDTHGYLDPKILMHFADCHEVWHAGDFGSDVADVITREKPLRGVFGNIDQQGIRILYPENLVFELENIKILMTHIGGKPGKYPTRVKEMLDRERPHLYICGHSHILQIVSDKTYNNMLFINPGAAGNEGFHKVKSIVKFDLHAGAISNMKVIELGPRGLKNNGPLQ